MRFVLQVNFNDAQARLDQLSEDERRAIVDEYIALFETAAVHDGNQLQSPATAMTVRVHDGETVAAPGPFAPQAEPLGGYYLVEADDVDAAIALAARVPAAPIGWGRAVRAVVQP